MLFVVDGASRAQLGRVLAEIRTAIPLGSSLPRCALRQQAGRQCVGCRRADLLALRFIVAEEEDLVLLDRAADGAAKAVLEAGGNRARRFG